MTYNTPTMTSNTPTMVYLEEAWEKFKIAYCDKAISDLSRYIQQLTAEFDDNVDYTCLYGLLCELIGDNTISSLLLSYTLAFLDKLVYNAGRREDLIFQLLPRLSYQIIHRYRQQPTDSMIKLCFGSLTNAVQDTEINFISSYTEDLIQILTKLLLKRKGTVFQEDALALLASLSRNNLAVQGIIKSQDNIRSLYTLLMTLISNDNSRVVVYSLSLFTTLCLNEDLGDKIFVGSATETITLVKDTLNFVADQDVKLCCLNLLIDFTRSQTMVSALANSQLFEDMINNYLTEESPQLRDKACKLLQHLATNDPGLRDQILHLVTPDIAQSLVGVVSRDVVSRGVVSRGVVSRGGSNACLPVLQLLKVLVPGILLECDVDTFVKQLALNIERIHGFESEKQSCKIVAISCQCLQVLLQCPKYKESVCSSLSSLPDIIMPLLQSVPPNQPLQIDYIKAVLGMITLSNDVNPDDYRQVLSHHNLQVILGQAMISGDISVTSTALTISTSCYKESGVFPPMISETISHHWYKTKSSSDKLEQEYTELQQKYTDLQMKSCNAMADHIPVQNHHSSQISDLIVELRDGLNISDVKTSQLIEMFQEKISIMNTKEEQLHELVETKNTALQQSDRIFTQFKNRVQQAERECSKYRSLLQEAESKAESTREEMCSLTNERNQLLEEVESLKSELVESNKYQEKYTATNEELQILSDKLTAAATLNSELSDKLEGLSEEIEILKVHNETLKSQHESDLTQVQVLQKEKQKVVTKLEEKDALYLKTKQTLRQSEDKNRKKDKEKIELETQISKIKSELSKTESKYQELQDREKSLESKLVEKDKLIEVQKAEVDQKNEEIEKYSKLMAMFHNLSSGRTSQR